MFADDRGLGANSGGARAPTRSNETDAAAKIGVVQRQRLADKIIGGSGAKITNCRGGMPHRRQIDLPDLADPVDGSIIDLAGPQRGDRRLIELTMQSGQRILARSARRR